MLHRVQVLSALLCGLLAAPLCFSQIKSETVTASTLAEPQATWFIVRDAVKGPGYVFDAASGEMMGLLSLTSYTPAVEVNQARAEIYAPEVYYSRGVRGERTDVVTIYDLPTLSPKAEIKVPNKIAALPFRQYIAMLDDNRHVAVFNMTPAFSVSLIDIKEQAFVGEVSTPGCALIMPTVQRAFLQMCGDGALQLLRFNGKGAEVERLRSQPFFDINEDPVFDKPVPTADGWLLTSYLGKVFHVTVDGSEISITEPWSMLSEEDFNAGWRPGGGQFIAYHSEQDLMFVLMNPGGEFAHDSSGTEIWVFDRAAQRRVHRAPIDYHGSNLFVSRGDNPLLTVTGDDGLLHVLDVATMTEVRSIAEAGIVPGHLQAFD